jgi:hypothetical protein
MLLLDALINFYIGKYNISGKNRFASIINEAVNESHTVNKTGAVDKYFKKLLSIMLCINYFIKITI